MTARRTIALALLCVSAFAFAACVRSTPREGEVTPAATPTEVAATAVPVTEPTPTSTPSPTATPIPPSPTPSPSPSPVAPTPTQAPSPEATETPVATFGLFLEVIGLDEESVVRGDSLKLTGVTSPDAVLSVNGVIIPLDDDGRFEVNLTLVPGPNLLEVVTSDLDGNMESKVITVISLPDTA